MIIEVTEEEMKLIENCRNRKKIFKICLENYGKAMSEIKKAVINLEDFLQDNEFYNEFRKKI